MACLRFMNQFELETKVNPLLEATNIASACNLVFRRNFLKPETIGIIPRKGYRWSDVQSVEAIQWLVWEEKEIKIIHAGNAREVVVRGNLKVNGYWHDTDNSKEHVWEYEGCFHHDCGICCRTGRDIPHHNNPFSTMNIKYESTMAKVKILKELGYVVHTMWKCQRKAQMKNNENISSYVKNHPHEEKSQRNRVTLCTVDGQTR